MKNNSAERHVNYDQVAPTYDKRYQRNQYAEIEQALLEFMGNDPGLQVLEVGCGTGHWLGILRAHGHHVVGLDFSRQMLAQAQASLPGIDLIRGQAERFPLQDQSFDRVFCINAIHHFDDKPVFLREARRILRPGGKMLTVGIDPSEETGQWYVYDYFPESLEIDKRRYPSSNQNREWMQKAGFENCVTYEVEHWQRRIPAREILAQGKLDKAATSQLTILTTEEYQQGMQKLKKDIERAETKGEVLFLEVDLRVYGTRGSVKE